MLRALSFLLLSSIALALRAGPATQRAPSPLAAATVLPRRLVLGGAVLIPSFSVRADDNEDDEIPDAGPKGPKRAPPSEKNKAPKTAADAAYAYADIVAARRGLDTLDTLVRASSYQDAVVILGKPPFSSFRENSLTLVQSPVLGPEDKKAIGTEKRFGLGADVIIMLGGLTDAVTSSDASGARSFIQKAKASLDEIIVICKSNGL